MNTMVFFVLLIFRPYGTYSFFLLLATTIPSLTGLIVVFIIIAEFYCCVTTKGFNRNVL